jgi:hypothetical protein
MKRRIAVSIASVALCLGGLVVAQAGAATRMVNASGGSVSFTASVRNAKTCGWSSSPKIAGFAKTVKCKTGTLSRSARFTVNTSTTAKSYAVTLTVRGKTTTVDHWKVTQAGETPPFYAIGATQQVQDMNKNTLAVTITQLIDPATGTDEFNQPDAGHRFVAVDMGLTNQSTGTISNDANLDVQVIGTDNQAYPADFDSVAECTNFSYGEFTLLPGGTESGCVVFQLPSGVNTKLVQFSLGYGYLDVAQWTVTP